MTGLLLQMAGFEVEVAIKDIRSIRLRVCAPGGLIRLSLPRGVPLERAEAFVEAKRDWILRYRQQLKTRESHPPASARTFSERESHQVWGKCYLISIIPSPNTPAVELRNGWLRLHVPPDSGVNERKKVVEQWEHRQLLDAIPPLLNHWQPVMGVRVAGFRVRSMKSRWGSCTIARRTIRLNLELARRHPDCLEYVLVHEMIHLLERSHNARFYTLMNHFLPDWQEREHRLNRQSLR